MKIADTVSEVLTSEDITPHSFTIKASRKAFQILSSGLYSDKIGAIVRELSCNAWDSHKENGNPEVPFEIHVPTEFEPWFSVKDWGTGLSHEAVLSVYTTYFQSTKTDSNDYTGALGLGSKTPFCYTDTFTVESRYNGIKAVYTSYLDGQGTPSICHNSDTETSEPNGVTVSFPVNNEDIEQFVEKIQKLCSYFSPLPLLSDGEVTSFRKELNTDQAGGETFHYFSGKYGSVRVLMGNILYKTQFNHVLTNYFGDILLEVPIGTFDVAASRESIVISDFSKKYILDYVEKLRINYVSSIQADIDACSNYKDACELAYKASNSKYLRLVPAESRLWKGRELGSEVRISKHHNDFHITSLRSPKLITSLPLKDKFRLIEVEDGDSLHNWKKRAEHACDKGILLYHLTVFNREKWTEFATEQGLSKYVFKSSEFPAIPKETSTSQGGQNSRAYNRIFTLNNLWSKRAQLAAFSGFPGGVPGTWVYSRFVCGKVELGGTRFPISALSDGHRDFMKYLRDEVETPHLLIQGLDLRKLEEKYPKITWVSYDDYAKNLYNQLVDDVGDTLDFRAALCNEYHHSKKLFCESADLDEKIWQALPEGHILRKWIPSVFPVKDRIRPKFWSCLCNVVGRSPESTEERVARELKYIEQKYPLLPYFTCDANHSFSNKFQYALVRYILDQDMRYFPS